MSADIALPANFNLAEHLPENFSGHSRVWIYQSSRTFSISEAFEIEKILADFVSGWKSHGVPVKGYANLFFGRFVVLMADETETSVGGCSTDSSVGMIREIQQRFSVDMLNRRQLAFLMKGKVEALPMEQIGYAIENGFIGRDSLYFNNTVLTREEMVQKWIVPASETWLSQYFVESTPK